MKYAMAFVGTATMATGAYALGAAATINDFGLAVAATIGVFVSILAGIFLLLVALMMR